MHLELSPLYPYTEKEKLAIRKEVGMKDNILEDDIDAILDWFYKQPHLAEAFIDRDYIERLLLVTRCSREKCKRRIDDFYRYKSYAPELVQSRIKDLVDPDYDPWPFYRQAAMLKLFDGKRISVFKIIDSNPSNFCSEVIFRNTIMLGELRLKYDYMLGDIWIIDFTNLSLAHILRVNLTMLQKFSHIVQEGIGFKMYEIHVVVNSSVGQHVVKLIKSFAKPKVMERLQLHGSMQELHKFIQKEYLPKDLGGEQPSLDEFKEMYKAEMQKPLMRDYMLKCCRQISNERKRIDGKYNEDYLIGSFKKLDFD